MPFALARVAVVDRLDLVEEVAAVNDVLELDGLVAAREVLEQLIESLSGGDAPVKLHYFLDRRDFLDKVKTVYARYS